MSTFYGSDSACITDVGLTDIQITNPVQLIGQRLARRLQTPRGGLAAFGGPADFGWDVRQLVLKKLTNAAKSTAQQQIEDECTKDEQVLSASCAITGTGGNLVITVTGISSAGPFTLTGNVQQFTAPEFFVS